MEATADVHRILEAARELAASQNQAGSPPRFLAALPIPEASNRPFPAWPRAIADCEVPSEGQAAETPFPARPKFRLIVAMPAATVAPAAVHLQDCSARDYCVLAWGPTEDGQREPKTVDSSLAGNAAEDGDDAVNNCDTMPVAGQSISTPGCSDLLKAEEGHSRCVAYQVGWHHE